MIQNFWSFLKFPLFVLPYSRRPGDTGLTVFISTSSTQEIRQRERTLMANFLWDTPPNVCTTTQLNSLTLSLSSCIKLALFWESVTAAALRGTASYHQGPWIKAVSVFRLRCFENRLSKSQQGIKSKWIKAFIAWHIPLLLTGKNLF